MNTETLKKHLILILSRLAPAMPARVVATTLLACLCAEAPAVAQSIATANASAEETVVLQPFEVDASQDTGYQAQNTLSGTRLNSPIADLAVTMTVFTPEVWQDLAFSSTNELINYTPGAETNYSGKFFFADSTKFRGILVENILRNSFKSNVPNDSYNADRMEFSRGPNAILVNGSSTTGGVNRTTSRAQFNNSGEVLLRVDDLGSFRGELDVNRELVEDKLAARFVALKEDAKTWREPIGFKAQTRFYGAVKWKPISKLTVDLTYEDIDWSRSLNDPFRPQDFATAWLNGPKEGRVSDSSAAPGVQPQGVVSYAGANTTMIVDDGNPSTPLVQNWRNYAVGAQARVFGTGSTVSVPEGLLDDAFDIVGNGLTHFMHGDVINLEVLFNPARNLYLTYNYNDEYMRYDFIRDNFSSRLQVDASLTLPDGVTPNPNFGRFFMGGETSSNRQDRNLDNNRLSLAYKLDFTERSDRFQWLGRHDITFALERERMDQMWDRPRLINETPLPGYAPLLNNPMNQVRIVTYLDPAKNRMASDHNPRNFIGNLAPGLNSQLLSETAGDTFSRQLESWLAVVQSRFWNDRIVTTLGFRSDSILEFQADPNWTRAPNGLAPDGHARSRIESANSGLSPETKTAAVVFHAIKSKPGLLNGLSFYYNRSDAVTLLFPELLLDGMVRPTTVGKTNDIGMRFQMLENRISGVVTVFDATSENERFNSAGWFGRAIAMDRAIGNVANAQPADVQDLSSKGYEFQLTANMTKNWRLSASYSHFQTLRANIGNRALPYIATRKDAWLANPDVQVPDYSFAPISRVYADMLTEQALELAQEGSRTNQERRDKITLLTHYAFTEGRLRGWAFGGDAIWTSAPSVAFGNASESGLILVDPDRVFFGEDMLTVGLHASYTMKNLFDRVDWKLQLNVTNVLNATDAVLETATVQPGTLQNTPVPLTYHLREPRAFVLTSTFTF